MLNVLPKALRFTRATKLQSTALRNFGGGLNTVDDDISMGPSFMPVLTNLRRNPNGSQQIRFGNSFFKDVSSVVTGVLVDMEYFNNRIIAVMSTGQVATIDGAGNAVAIWNNTIAALLPGAPSGWSNNLTSIDFIPFRQQFIIHNGVDKPITISATFVVTYLQDLVTGSNVNVPIGKYGAVVSNYHCIAGIPSAPTTVYVSSQSTAGVFPGDPPPNDAINFDVGAYAPEGSSEIRGIAGYRTNLVIFFVGAALIVELGNYVGAVHTPKFPDSLTKFGLLGHRAIAIVEQDLTFGGLAGISNAKRSLFSGLLDGTFESGQVETKYRNAVATLTDAQRLLNCFMIHDEMAHDMLFFVPPNSVFVRSAQTKLNYASWSFYTAMDWVCGCRSILGRVFLGSGTRIYQMGNSSYANENFYADKMNDYTQVWAPSTLMVVGTIVLDATSTDQNKCWTVNVTHTSGVGTFQQDRDATPANWRKYVGRRISFEMELPWIYGNDPLKTKLLRYVNVLTKGVGGFTLDAYVDNLYKDEAGNVLYNPAVTMDFVGNDSRGYGFDEGFPSAQSTEYSLRTDNGYILRPDGSRIIRVADDGEGPFGTGRRSADPRLYGFPVKCKSVKFKIRGSTRRFLQFVGINFAFARGNYRR